MTACDVYLLSRAALLAAFQNMAPTKVLDTALHWDAAGGSRQHELGVGSRAHGTGCHTEEDAAGCSVSPGPATFEERLQSEHCNSAQSRDLLLGTAPDWAEAGQPHVRACASHTAHQGVADEAQQHGCSSRLRGPSLPMRNMLQALLELRPGEDLCEVQPPAGGAFEDAVVHEGANDMTDASDCFLDAR